MQALDKKRPRGDRHLPGPGPQRKEATVDSKSLAHSSTAFVDGPFCKEISELTGIEYRTLNAAFTGERKDLALDTVKTIVAENLDVTPAAWTEKFREHAKAEGLGEYRPG
jgi:hypothetical protein